MKKSNYSYDRGFTLLELLLSMAISAIIIVMVFGTFRVGIRAWERGERDTEKQQRLRTVTELLRKQLRSITLPAVPIIKKEDLLIDFEGIEQRMTFVSRLSLDPANQHHRVYTRYEVESTDMGDRLYLWEQPLLTANEPIDILSVDPDERHQLLSGMQSITFQYLKRKDKDAQEGHQWEAEWESAADDRFPPAVKIRIIDSRLEAPVQMIIPLFGQKVI